MDPQLKLLGDSSWRGRAIAGARVPGLLRALANAGPRGSSAEALIDALWPESSPEHPAKALQILVSRARALTSAETIARTETGYRLNLSVEDVDVWAWGQATAEAEDALDRGDASRAIECARRSLLLADSSVARRVHALASSRRGEHREALPELERLAAESPHDEAVAVHTLRSLAAVEGAAAALQAYAALKRRLAETLGVDPGPALQAVQRELLAADRPQRSGLRSAATSFLGRASDLADLTAHLASARLVSIIGPGGLGKTRLAQELARTVTIPNIGFVELVTVNEGDEVLAAIAETLQVRESPAPADRQHSARDLRSRVIARLATGSYLLVLDNCEHVMDGVIPVVADLLTAVEGLTVLTTSRTPLRIAAEQVYHLGHLSESDAVDLFVQRARAARRAATLDSQLVSEIVGHLDGLPLAIEMAAAKVRTLAAETILDSITERFELLRGEDRAAPDRHRTLRAMIDWSWQLLDVDARTALMVMSLLPDSFTLACAKGALGQNALRLIDGLVDQSLLVVIERDGEVRYRMLETVREYGALKRYESESGMHAQQLLGAWAVALCREVLPQLVGARQLEAVERLRCEEHNLAFVSRLLLEHRDERAVLVLAALLTFWMTTGAHIEILTQMDAAETYFNDCGVPHAFEEESRLVLSALVVTWGRVPAWRQRLQNTSRLLVNLVSDGRDPFIIGLYRLARAIVTNDGSIEELTRSDHRYTAMTSSLYLSGLLENSGEIVAAIGVLEQSARLLEADAPPWFHSEHYSSLSQLHMQFGNFARAEQYAERALPIQAVLGDTVAGRAVLACTALNLGRLDEAESLLNAVMRTRDGDDSSVIHFPYHLVSVGLAELALARGHAERGLAVLQQTSQSGRRLHAPGIDFLDGIDPWNLLLQGLIISVLARHPDPGDETRLAGLLELATRATAPQREHYDLPVLGTVAFGIAVWGLRRCAMPEDESVFFLALADRLGYNRAFPSLRWETVAETLTDAQANALSAWAEQLRGQDRAAVIAAFHSHLVVDRA